MPPIAEVAEKPTIGIIYPPPEVRNIVDKTASFVARNGPEFEARIRQNEINNPKFNFLNPGDPYNGYYHHKVQEFKEGKAAPEPPAPTPPQKTQAQKQAEIIKAVESSVVVLKDPPSDFEFVADPPSISAFDLDVVKLTAQFVARNGRQFLTNLMNREQRNYQFDFLRPQHSLFNYFTKLLEQYTKVLIPPKDLMNKLKKESFTNKDVLSNVKYRVEWMKQQEAQKRREEEEAEKERVSYAQIDWHDFVVVETVDYQPNEQGDFPPPTTPEEVGTRVLILERLTQDVEMDVDSGDEEEKETRPKKTANDNTQVRDMDEDSDDEGDRRRRRATPPPPPMRPPIVPAPQVPPGPPLPENVIVRKDYDPKAHKPQKPIEGNYLVSPITGDRIPADKVQEHMRIGLLDPRWVEQRDKALSEKLQQEEVFAPGGAIGSSLKNLAERRTDIFGIGDEETVIGKKIGEEDTRKEEKVTWDGHTASMEAATRAARANITIEDQIHQIHKVKGLLPDEEKEKIGPSKPMGSIITSKPGEMNLILGPPPMSKPPVAPPIPTQRTMVSAMPQMPPPIPQQPVMGQPGLMMMPRPPMQPPPMMGMPPRPPGMPMMAPNPFQPAPVQPPMPRSEPDEPPSKRQKNEEALIPENEFLMKNKSPVSFRVQVPVSSDKAEWKLNGQILTFTVPLTDMVSVIKAKIHEETGMPAGKQKLQYDGIFIKDSNSLAFYNFTPGSLVSLQVKERGGRKK